MLKRGRGYTAHMSEPEYRWRQLSPEQREDLLAWRRSHGHPWHSPPHWATLGHQRYLITAACYEHQPYIGQGPARMDAFAGELLAVFGTHASETYAWCVLPNHYHALLATTDVRGLLGALGKLHGRSAWAWNGKEGTRGRQVFSRSLERLMRSERH